MGAWGSLAFHRGHHDDGVLLADEEAPTRADNEGSLASCCKLVHERSVTLVRFLSDDTRTNVNELRLAIGSYRWTEEAHTLLDNVWKSVAARWMCKAVEYKEEEEKKEEEERKEEEQKDELNVEDPVPWDMTWDVVDCALLVRSVCCCFLGCSLELPCH